MSYQTAVDWFEDELSGTEDFGDFTENDIISTLGDVANRAQSGGRNRTYAVRNDDDFITPFIDKSSKLEDAFETVGDLNIYGKAIDRGFKKDTAKYIGTQVARRMIRTDRFADIQESEEWIRKYNPSSLGQLKGILTKESKAYRTLFGVE